MAIYDAGPYKLVMRDDQGERAQLVKDGWAVIASATTRKVEGQEATWYWIMTQPGPTLAERVRHLSLEFYAGSQWRADLIAAADALERVEELAKKWMHWDGLHGAITYVSAGAQLMIAIKGKEESDG